MTVQISDLHAIAFIDSSGKAKVYSRLFDSITEAENFAKEVYSNHNYTINTVYYQSTKL
jgi:hypothetical protein